VDDLDVGVVCLVLEMVVVDMLDDDDDDEEGLDCLLEDRPGGARWGSGRDHAF